MQETIERNPAIILVIELSASAAPQQTVSFLRDRGFDGWELQRNRAIPLQPPDVYERLVDDYVDVIVSRSAPAIDDVVRRLYSRR